MDWKRLLIERNEAWWDQAVRIALGGALVLVPFVWIGGILGWLVALVGVIALFTGITGHCTLYPLIGWQTRRKKAQGKPPKRQKRAR